jgi:AraC-like DNA-binding protein
MTDRIKDFATTHEAGVAFDVVRTRFNVELVMPKLGDAVIKSRFFELPSFKLWWASNSGPASITIPQNETTHVHFILRGRCSGVTGKHQFDVREGEAFVSSVGHAAHLDYHSDHEELVLIIPPATMERVFTSLCGFPPRCPIKFEPQITSSPRFGGFRDLVMMVSGRLDPAGTAWSDAALELLEIACVTELLFCGRHNLRHLLETASLAPELPHLIRVAEHFAEVNAARDIGIEEMANAAAVSVSTLSRAFLKYRGCTPTAFIKRTRLVHAKHLLESRAATTVVGVALRCGFTNPSRFGKDYQKMFGETPTETLRRLRAQPGA